MRGPLGRAAAGAIAGLLLVACSAEADDGEVEPIPDDATEQPPESSEPEEEPDPFAIPDDIDVDYVQRVVDELLPLLDEADRIAIDHAPQSIAPDEVIEIYRATHSPSMSTTLLTDVSTRIANEASAEELEERLDEQGEIRWVVTDVGEASVDCVAFTFDYEFSAQDTELAGIGTLLPAQEGRDPADHNATPWVIGLNGTTETFDAEFVDACDASQQAEQEFLEESEDHDEESGA